MDRWLSRVFEGSGIPLNIVRALIIVPQSQASKTWASVKTDDLKQAESNGLLSCTTVSRKRRGALARSYPSLSSSSDLDQALTALKILCQVRFRPLRASGVLAAIALVENLLKRFSSQDWTSSESKDALLFCGRVCSTVIIPRARDTSAVIRQIVAEGILSWSVLNVQVLSSSVFGKSGTVMDSIMNLLIDDERDIRSVVIGGLHQVIAAHGKISLSPEFVQILISSLLVRCEELSEGESSEAASIEISSHARLVVSLTSNELIDMMEKSDSPVFENLYQLLWDPLTPLEARASVARIVSMYVFSADLFSPTFTNAQRGLDMVLAFIAEYSPWNEPASCCSTSVLQAFFHQCDSTMLGEYFTVSASSRCEQAVELFAYLIQERACLNLGITKPLSSLFPLIAEDERIANTVLMLVETGYLPTISSEEIVACLQAVFDTTSRSFAHTLTAVKIWVTMADSITSVRDALSGFRRDIEASNDSVHILALEACMNTQATNSAVLIDRLLAFLSSDKVSSVEDLVCAVDLLIMHCSRPSAAKDDDAETQRRKAMNELRQILVSIKGEISDDAKDDAKAIAWFCQRRLTLLDGVSAKSGKREAPVLVETKGGVPVGTTANAFVMNRLIRDSVVDSPLLSVRE